MKTILFDSVKGGTGKTFIASNFAAVLGEKGYRVMYCDYDSINSFTGLYMMNKDIHTLSDYIDKTLGFENIIYKCKYFNFFSTSGCLTTVAKTLRYKVFDDQREVLVKNYDFIIIDGSVDYESRKALRDIADEIITIATDDYFSINSLKMNENDDQAYTNKILGILKNRIDETVESCFYVDKLIMEATKSKYRIFKNFIRESVYADRHAIAGDIFILGSNSGIEKDMINFVNEYLTISGIK